MVRQAHHPEQGRRTDGVFPMASWSITLPGGEAGALPFGRYNLISRAISRKKLLNLKAADIFQWEVRVSGGYDLWLTQ